MVSFKLQQEQQGQQAPQEPQMLDYPDALVDELHGDLLDASYLLGDSDVHWFRDPSTQSANDEIEKGLRFYIVKHIEIYKNSNEEYVKRLQELLEIVDEYESHIQKKIPFIWKIAGWF
jgi:hypothetical protein